ncbi:hypothetical protein BJ742DRAFT_97571 [Cladochytrium replicatum]|nr:hypothetical protein BJ742DRAFT_97571 [Cladochytrium replicatum]
MIVLRAEVGKAPMFSAAEFCEQTNKWAWGTFELNYSDFAICDRKHVDEDSEFSGYDVRLAETSHFAQSPFRDFSLYTNLGGVPRSSYTLPRPRQLRPQQLPAVHRKQLGLPGGRACGASSDCENGDVCGVSFNAGQSRVLKTTCGKRQGYRSARPDLRDPAQLRWTLNCQSSFPYLACAENVSQSCCYNGMARVAADVA